MKNFGGSVLFLDRSDINTDEIIPAKYLTENSKEALKPYILEDLKLPGFEPKKDIPGKGVIVTRGNFGCGSSREHAPWVLEVNGINLVIAESFARIFRQNMYNCGMIAAELAPDVLEGIFRKFAARETTLRVDIEAGTLTFISVEHEEILPFTLKDFERALVSSGGWVEYAAHHY
ncbi:MAG: 3-isopropylmalate dehydratase small subunit [Spirochaetaceae bacterium]|jgi:3-isopropylmalate/(R)-2-methylmalate dehydratase small subunit|nr:3-isopropylmalate dehydratase small subunit [Spirochaetaceae bacterium]